MSSDEDFSDLTELESEDEYAASTQKRGKKETNSNVRTGWRVKNALKVPRATTYTAQALYDQIYGCDINLEPEYQRDVVWSEAKQIGIIDSVFRNFYIPPVIFAVNVHEDGSETKTCIDGKQRLTSIHKFMEGLIPHKDPTTGEKLWYKDIESGGRKRKLLPEKYRRLFANKQIVCVEYQDITDSDEREIFQRVQLGMALTPAEKLQVVKTPRTDLVRELQSEYLKDDGWLGPKHLTWDQTRGSDFRVIAFALYCIDTFSGIKWSLVTMSKLEKWLAINEPLAPKTQEAVHDTFRIFSELVQDEKLKKVLKNPPKISPVEFIGMTLLIYRNKDKASLAQLSAGIGEMRSQVRAVHIDVRLNSRVTKTILEIIGAWVPKKIAGDKGAVANSTKDTAGVKRKRATKETEDAEDLPDGSEMEVDEDGGNKTNGPTSKKPTPSMTNTSEATPTPQIKTEPVGSPAQIPAKPAPYNRMTALMNAKAAVARNQAARAQQTPNGPRALRNEMSNPQMLPSPTQPSAFADDLAAAFSTANGTNNNNSLPSGSAYGSSSRPNNAPPPPTSASSSMDTVYRNGDRDWMRDSGERDRERDRDRNRERSRERDRYSRSYDVDRIRDRRDSGYLNRRSRSPPGRRPYNR